MTTTFRADARAGLYALLTGFQAANGTLLRSAFPARPEGFTGDYPIGFVDTQPEAVTHTSGVRTRTMSPAIAIVGEYRLNGEHASEFDPIVDAFLDYCTDRPHVVTGTIWDRMTIEDYEETMVTTDGKAYLRPAVRFTFANLSIAEGRSP